MEFQVLSLSFHEKHKSFLSLGNLSGSKLLSEALHSLSITNVILQVGRQHFTD